MGRMKLRIETSEIPVTGESIAMTGERTDHAGPTLLRANERLKSTIR
jgi:hypothetical protein